LIQHLDKNLFITLLRAREMNKISILITSLTCIILATIFIYFSGTSNEPTEQTEKEKTNTEINTPTVSMHGMILRERLKQQDYNLVLTARASKLYHTSHTIESDTSTCKLFYKHDLIAHLLSNKSVLNRKKKEARFIGSVSGFFKDLSFTGSDVVYNFSTQHLFSDKNITYTHQQFILFAEKSNIDLNKERIEMENVKSVFLYSSATNSSSQ